MGRCLFESLIKGWLSLASERWELTSVLSVNGGKQRWAVKGSKDENEKLAIREVGSCVGSKASDWEKNLCSNCMHRHKDTVTSANTRRKDERINGRWDSESLNKSLVIKKDAQDVTIGWMLRFREQCESEYWELQAWVRGGSDKGGSKEENKLCGRSGEWNYQFCVDLERTSTSPQERDVV